jgi:hypothetical protein
MQAPPGYGLLLPNTISSLLFLMQSTKHEGHYVTNNFVINIDHTEEVDTSDYAFDRIREVPFSIYTGTSILF